MNKFIKILLITIFLILNLNAENRLNSEVEISIIKTGDVNTLEAFIYDKGSYFKMMTLNHSAFLVKHPKGLVLFDTGLGKNIDEQFELDMPWWGKIIFSYNKGISAKQQIENNMKLEPDIILLSHSHWDHASGIMDFEKSDILINEKELEFLKKEHQGSVFPSQFMNVKTKLTTFKLVKTDKFEDFDFTFDLFEDGSVVIVGLEGHTLGQVGLFITTSTNKKFFFVSDVVWSNFALELESEKFFISSCVTDYEKSKNLETMLKLKNFAINNPDVIIIPTHDANIQDKLGYFPKWIK